MATSPKVSPLLVVVALVVLGYMVYAVYKQLKVPKWDMSAHGRMHSDHEVVHDVIWDLHKLHGRMHGLGGGLKRDPETKKDKKKWNKKKSYRKDLSPDVTPQWQQGHGSWAQGEPKPVLTDAGIGAPVRR